MRHVQRWGTIRTTTRKALGLFGAISLLILPVACRTIEEGYDPRAIQRNIFDSQRVRLTAEYSRIHYGPETSELREPRMIVLHYTAIPTLDGSLRFFLPSLLDVQFRKDISSGGAVNVSAHYLVDRDGAVVQLASENVICRHIIGFNYTAIAIENVGSNSAELTEAQAQSDAALVSRIKKRHPSIEYLIGHQQDQDRSLPHFKLFIEKDSTYRFTEKQDPGILFLDRVKTILKETYGLVFKQ